MISLLGMATAYIIAKKLDDMSDYRKPVGKYKNRYAPWNRIF